jgi:hypothetical protein
LSARDHAAVGPADRSSFATASTLHDVDCRLELGVAFVEWKLGKQRRSSSTGVYDQRGDEVARLGGEWNDIDDVPPELPGAKALKNDMLFAKDGPYGIPNLRDDMLGRLPSDTQVWWRAGGDCINPDASRCLWLFRNSSLVGIPRDRIGVAFYVNDYQFEAVWDEPAKYAAKFVNIGVRELIAPNFSLFSDHAQAIHIWNVYRSRWCAR